MRFYALGIGPGDGKLITVKAVDILKKSDKVYVPQSDETGRSVALDIVKNYIPLEKIQLYYFPMNNNRDELNIRYKNLADMIKGDLNDGLIVSYVTIGDPLIYSTFNYLYEKLDGVDIEIVPGISSFSAVASVLKRDIVQKGESFCVIEPEHFDNFNSLLELFDTIIVMKAHRGIEKLKNLLKGENRVKDAYLVSRVGLDGELIIDLKKDSDISKAYLSVAFLKVDRGCRSSFITSKKGADIERESFQIIDDLVDLSRFDEDEKVVAKRMIHASGDVSIANDIIFSSGWKDKIFSLLKKNTPVITDVEMVRSGIGSKYDNLHCFINDLDIIEKSKSLNLTRAELSIEKGFNLFDDIIFVVGNAPTALLKIIELNKVYNKNIFIIGIPVGFVSAKESKDLLLDYNLDFITVRGFKGGSSIAVAAFNAILRLFRK
ncbi:MAG: precorrin-2 C(20)-methyltransferase [Calditerrivibrio sp.]|nr:precorrin-2 C(20)-methyltransferase [Calditerrivibrio sp.]MCA1932715.1 precorrin-2 C(20)-methyltransferase [Calditerrivibrio sp.]